jgi:hypothetical protein
LQTTGSDRMLKIGDGIIIVLLLMFAAYLYYEARKHSTISMAEKLSFASAQPVQGLETGAGSNLARPSGPFGDALWWRERLVVIPAFGIAPDRTKTADRLVETSEFGRHRAGTTVTGARAGEAHTLSLYVKRGERQEIQFEMADTPSGEYGLARFDLTRKVVVTKSGDVSDAGMQVLPDGWYRCWATMLYASETVTFNFSLMVDDEAIFYSGDSHDGLLVWGIQFEPGSRPRGYAR